MNNIIKITDNYYDYYLMESIKIYFLSFIFNVVDIDSWSSNCSCLKFQNLKLLITVCILQWKVYKPKTKSGVVFPTWYESITQLII